MNKQLIKEYCADNLRKAHEKYLKEKDRDQQAINNIRRKIKDGNLIITRANKGKCTVITEKQNYITRVEDILKDNSFIIQNRFNLNSFTTLVRKTIKKMKNTVIPSVVGKHLIPNNPISPRLYA